MLKSHIICPDVSRFLFGSRTFIHSFLTPKETVLGELGGGFALTPRRSYLTQEEKATQTGWRAVWGYLILIFEHSRRGALGLGARSSGLPASSETQTAGNRGREPQSPHGRGRASWLAPDSVRLFSAAGQLHLGPPTRTIAVHAPACGCGRARLPGRTLGSDLVRNLRDGAPSHGATETRPLARHGRDTRGRRPPARPPARPPLNPTGKGR